MPHHAAYTNKRVLVTGDSGFKGQHLARTLAGSGAHVFRYSLPRDVRDAEAVFQAVMEAQPDYVFHLAAQSFVPRAFEVPRWTFETNTLGTVNVLDAVRRRNAPCAVVVVTSDKVYSETREAHVEDSPLGGHDPYSSSKAAAEAVVIAYRDGFFAPRHDIAVATARAGNVIGPGDFGHGRLIPNAIRALRAGKPIPIWNPEATRPWQYVDDVLDGYLLLGAHLHATRGDACSAWNFGPLHSHTVREVAEIIISEWGSGTWEYQQVPLREANTLAVDSTKAREVLGWQPRWEFEAGVRATVRWYKTLGMERVA